MSNEQKDADAAAVAVAPRVTLEDIESKIVCQQFITSADIDAANPCAAPVSAGVLTICILTLENGFTVTGESACADPRNFDKMLGRKIASQNAVAKIWALEGYVLRNTLAGTHKVAQQQIFADAESRN